VKRPLITAALLLAAGTASAQTQSDVMEFAEMARSDCVANQTARPENASTPSAAIQFYCDCLWSRLLNKFPVAELNKATNVSPSVTAAALVQGGICIQQTKDRFHLR
jgi:hypothetical protein